MGRSNTMCAAFMSITSDGMTAIPRHWTGSPRDLAQGTLDYMGGTEAVLTRAEADFTAGDYSWVVHIVDQIIWAEADKYVGPPAGGPTPIWLWRGKPNMAQCLLVGGQRVATRGAEGG